MYTIEVEYQTGDSFNTERVSEQIGLVWEDKDLARKALQSIKEHYKLQQELDSYNWKKSRRSDEEIYAEVRSKGWYKNCPDPSGDKKNHWHAMWFCCAELDDGSFRAIPTNMWIGYFEKLHSAKVVVEDSGSDEDCVIF